MPEVSLRLQEVRDALEDLRTETRDLREAVAARVSHPDLEARLNRLSETLNAEQDLRRQQVADYEEGLRKKRARTRRRWVIWVAVLVALSVWGRLVREARDDARLEQAIMREHAVAVQACEDRRELALIVAGIFNSSTTADEERRAELDEAAQALLGITDASC